MTMLKNRRFLILFFLIILLGANRLYRIIAINSTKSENRNLRILTFNLNASEKILEETTADSLCQIILNVAPEIVCFQEVRYLSEIKFRHTMDSVYSQRDTTGQDVNQHALLYSKYPFKNFQQLENLKIYSADVYIGNMWVRIYSCHLTSNGYTTARRRVLGQGGNWFSGVSDYYKNIQNGRLARKKEAKALRASIDSAESKGMPVLVIGDLNDFSGSDCLDIIQGDDLEDAWWNSGNGFGFTYDAWHLKLRIDHVLYSKDDFEPIHSEVIDSDISDHKPLFVDLKLK